jgi:ATP-binding cassette subfamily B protein
VKEVMLGIRVVKSFGLEPRLVEEANNVIDSAARQGMKVGNLSARSGPIMEALVGLAMAAIILYSGYGLGGKALDAGSLLAFLTALLLTYAPAKNLARLSLNLETALIGVEVFYGFMDQPVEFRDAPDARPLVAGTGDVELRNVSFSYGNDAAALTDASIHFPAGKLSALVGGSGAGKSTIFSLIERFYEPQAGAILINGQDISKVTIASLRENISFVTQDAFLFEGTIYDNIRAGRWTASEEEVFAAARAANAHEFIVAHPEGYQRVAGEGGGNLSGGQKQRVAIARAMLRNAPILLLDEATSALDAASEVKVKDALNELMKGRTTIVIAHRLSTVRQADVIHVMESGRLIESGTHNELIALRGAYAELSALQLSPDPVVPAAAE